MATEEKKTATKKKKVTKKKHLVIVESPAKAKTIEKMLGRNYAVTASFGHIRDLPKSKLGVDVENNFEPSYSTIKGKGEVTKNLRALAKKSDKIFLASDPDREGEAIAWHIAHILKLPEDDLNRIEFNEITKTAIKEAVSNPRRVDINKVDAQQARRILDRLVGYSISPLLWKVISSNTSAGRVQSVALKLICDLEDTIAAFVPEKYWEVNGEFRDDINLKLYKIEGEKVDRIFDEKVVRELEKELAGKDLEVVSAKITDRSKKPPLPLKTSTLQQLSSSYLGFSASKTMRVAQSLYEGQNIDGTLKGLITYMRTDSTRISNEAKEAAKSFINEKYGKEYVGNYQEKQSKGKVQDAHEAVRPSYVELEPNEIKQYLNDDQYKLYKLIWERFIISQLAPMKYKQFEFINEYDKYQFRGTANKITFDGYYKVFKGEGEIKTVDFPNIQKGDIMPLEKLLIKDGITKPPARLTESSIVKKLESDGIGRPSTYASIIETLKKREYVELSGKSFIPTPLGYEVKEELETNFPHIMNVKFTAEMENKLDLIEEGEVEWKKVLGDFYEDLSKYLTAFQKKVEEIENRRVESDVPCPCGSGIMIMKSGRFGRYLMCEDESCEEKYSLKGIDLSKEELAAGKIIVRDIVEVREKKKRGQPTDMVADNGAKLLLKLGPFGSYLESENFKEDGLRIPLPASIKKMLAEDEIQEVNGIMPMKAVTETALAIAKGKPTDMVTDKGARIYLKPGRYGHYLESEDYKQDEVRIKLNPELKKLAKEEKLEERDGLVVVKKYIDRDLEENKRLVEEAGPCEKCGKPFVVKEGRWGKFLACSNEKCKNMRKLPKKK